MDTIPERFSRAAGQAPRAAVAAYAMAILSAAVALTVGLIGGTAYSIAIGVGAAIASAITWAVIGTIAVVVLKDRTSLSEQQILEIVALVSALIVGDSLRPVAPKPEEVAK